MNSTPSRSSRSSGSPRCRRRRPRPPPSCGRSAAGFLVLEDHLGFAPPDAWDGSAAVRMHASGLRTEKSRARRILHPSRTSRPTAARRRRGRLLRVGRQRGAAVDDEAGSRSKLGPPHRIRKPAQPVAGDADATGAAKLRSASSTIPASQAPPPVSTTPRAEPASPLLRSSSAATSPKISSSRCSMMCASSSRATWRVCPAPGPGISKVSFGLTRSARAEPQRSLARCASA